ncbi:MAG: 4'-phosphopantetheinyl transferase superfamily protein [Desulfobacterales bacterium]
MDAIFPVLMAVSPEIQQLRGPAQVQALSREGRRVVRCSADQQGVSLGVLTKNRDGAPLPVQGWYWSVSHKTDLVAGVIARHPIGIDVEVRRPCSEALCRRIADPAEWDLAGGVTEVGFFRIWTAKEAVLKAVGLGMKALSRCRIEALDGTDATLLSLDRGRWRVAHFYLADYVAAVTDSGVSIRWVTAGLAQK